MTEEIVRIVDDDINIRESFCFLLNGVGWTTKAYPNAETFLEEDDLSQPGCIVLDVRMNNISGLELQQKLLEISPLIPIILVSAYGDIEMSVYAIKQGAFDFLPKPVNEKKLLEDIEKASELCRRRFQDRLKYSASISNWSELTSREKEVAQLIAQGCANKVIGTKLEISTSTVMVHRARIYQKLKIHSAVGIADFLRRIATKDLTGR